MPFRPRKPFPASGTPAATERDIICPARQRFTFLFTWRVPPQAVGGIRRGAAGLKGARSIKCLPSPATPVGCADQSPGAPVMPSAVGAGAD